MRFLRRAREGDRLLREVLLSFYKARWSAMAACVALGLCAMTGRGFEAAHAQPATHGAAIILMYHHVSPTVLPGPYARALTVTPQEFSQQLSWLRSHGCRMLTVDALLSDVDGSRTAACEAALTFDDGYADVVTYALPLLQKSGALGTFYIATGSVGQSGHVSVRELRFLHAAGMEIGAHTVHHVDLTTLDERQKRQEVLASATSLRQWLNAPVTAFAYPAGRYDASVARAVAGAGLASAVTTDEGVVTRTTDRYALPRYRIERGTGLGLMQALFAETAQGPKASAAPAMLQHIARERIAGNAPQVAEDIAVAILARSFPEQVVKVHVLALPSATVAGIVLSGVKFHAPVDRGRFAGDVRLMVDLALGAAPQVSEVDVWATVPQAVPAGADVSGDYAVPASKTVFSCAVTRAQARTAGTKGLGVLYWDPGFLHADSGMNAAATRERL